MMLMMAHQMAVINLNLFLEILMLFSKLMECCAKIKSNKEKVIVKCQTADVRVSRFTFGFSRFTFDFSRLHTVQ